MDALRLTSLAQGTRLSEAVVEAPKVRRPRARPGGLSRVEPPMERYQRMDTLLVKLGKYIYYINRMTLNSLNGNDGIEVSPEIRESYIQAISAISPCDEIEAKDIEKTLKWLESAEHVNKPHNMDEHLGVFSVILSEDRKQTFLLNHRKAKLWLPPGGHVDLGQKLDECAVMEVEEELGMKEPKLIIDIPVFLTRTLTQGTNAGHIDVTAWLLLEGEVHSTFEIQEKEASQSGWIQIEELLQTAELSNLHRGFKKIVGSGLLSA